MNRADKFLVGVSVFMIAAGAVNHGITRWYMAVPFMIYLVRISYRYRKPWRMLVIGFILCAILISANREKISILYPIIYNGKVVIPETQYEMHGWAGFGTVMSESELNNTLSFLSGTEKLRFKSFENDFSQKTHIVTFNTKSIDKEMASYEELNAIEGADENGIFSRELVKVKNKGDNFKILKMVHRFDWDYWFFGPMYSESFVLYADNGEQYFVPMDDYSSHMQEGKYGMNSIGTYFSLYTFNKEIISKWSLWLSNIMPFFFILFSPIVIHEGLQRKFQRKID